jgi:membrane protease YdiL (CAAX protease family)
VLWAAALIWVVGAIAGVVYARQVGIPQHVALAVMPAFLLELTGYLILGVERWRKRIERFPPAAVATVLTFVALVPYTLASLGAGSFDWQALAWVALLAAAVSFWYVALPHKLPADLLFLVFMIVVWMSRTLRNTYASPHYPKLQLEVLAHLMWVRTGGFAMLSVRRMRGVGFGFWPEPREWKIGTGYFAAFVLLGGPLGYWWGFASPRWPAAGAMGAGWERVTLLLVVTFFGSLWVLALSEEFVFRGLLQQWMTAWLRSEWAGLGAAALVFGTVHLWMRPFPNWRNAVLAGILGVLCGLAFRQARSIRASMVTHALTITVWRVFFS